MIKSCQLQDDGNFQRKHHVADHNGPPDRLLAAERVPEHCDRAALICCLASLQPDLLSAWHVLTL